ncbi:MAG: hypothetical protein Q8L52_01990, partial [bacterium]|nr:hypothetical protein [bacterium]
FSFHLFLNSLSFDCIRFANYWIELPPKKNLKLSAVRLRRLSEFSRGEFLAAAGGEMRSD